MNTSNSLTRRQLLQSAAITGLGASAAPWLDNSALADNVKRVPAKADSMIVIWLPGGVAQTDCWDPKQHTPFRAGMKGSELLGTCPSIDTSVDGLKFGAGLSEMASVAHHGTVLRSLTNETKFGAVHLKAQYYMMTGYLFPVGVKAPSIGAVTSRVLGPRAENVPPYIYIGRDIDTSDTEKQFVAEAIGPGFYGLKHAPFMIPDPTAGLATLNTLAGMTPERLDRKLQYLRSVSRLAGHELNESAKAAEYLQSIDAARAMMDSPVKKAFDYAKQEKPETIAAYEPRITRGDLLDKWYWFGQRFAHGLLMARRLVEVGARFVQVELQYAAFKGFDTHENGAARLNEMKRQIDAPIAQLIRDLADRGLLERTLVVVATEFGRTIANAPKAGVESFGFAEQATGDDLVIADPNMYGFHGHFSSANSLLFYGGGFKRGYVHGKTAERHPMIPVENPVNLTDVHATLYSAMGISPETHFVTEGRPFQVTKDGKGKPITALLA
jgi:hypothetical protein